MKNYLLSIKNHKSQIINHKSAFGLLEVVISIGILVIVMSATVFTNRLAVRGSIIANQRAQAYNLVRQNLELLRVMRDSIWVDKIVNEWNTPFSNATFGDNNSYYLVFFQEKWQLKSGSQMKNLDGSNFTEKISFNQVEENLTKELQTIAGSTNLNSVQNPNIINAQVVVSWQSYGQNHSVTGSIQLTDWKPQI